MNITDYCNPNCKDCDGEGHYEVAKGLDDSEDIPCQTCFPPTAGNIVGTTWADLEEDWQ